MIFDAAHGTALLRQSGHVQYLAMDITNPPAMPTELNWQALWKRFFHALTIEERRNAKAQMSHAPGASGAAWWRCVNLYIKEAGSYS